MNIDVNNVGSRSRSRVASRSRVDGTVVSGDNVGLRAGDVVDVVGSRAGDVVDVDGEVVDDDDVSSRSIGLRSRVAGDVGSCSRSRVDGEVVDDDDDSSRSLGWCSRVDGEVVDDDDDSSRSRVDVRIAHGGNARADDAGAVGMGRGSGARPRRLPTLILRIVFFERS